MVVFTLGIIEGYYKYGTLFAFILVLLYIMCLYETGNTASIEFNIWSIVHIIVTIVILNLGSAAGKLLKEYRKE